LKFLFVLEILIIIIIAGFIGFKKIKDKVVEKAADQMMETVITNQAREMGATDEEIKEVLDRVSEEDKETVETIVQNHMDGDVISQGITYIQNGDIEGLEHLATEELSQEEMEELMELYDKYKDEIEY